MLLVAASQTLKWLDHLFEVPLALEIWVCDRRCDSSQEFTSCVSEQAHVVSELHALVSGCMILCLCCQGLRILHVRILNLF